MALTTVVVCTDGSELARQAARAGFAVLVPPDDVRVVTVIEAGDDMAVAGTGMAGGVVTPDEAEALDRARAADGQRIADRTVADLGLSGAQASVLRGAPGPAICGFAAEYQASAIVMGSRGGGRIRKALLGSVSDYVIRNAPCPVVVTGPTS